MPGLYGSVGIGNHISQSKSRSDPERNSPREDEMNKKYNYYIAYQMKMKGKKKGRVINGNCHIECENKLDNRKDIEEMQGQVRKQLKAEKLMIFWWTLLK